MDRDSKMLSVLAVFTFCLSPILAWISVRFSSESAVFASLSRMIWYSGSAAGIFVAMLVLFIPMLVAFFLSHRTSGLSKVKKLILRALMLVSCFTLYLGAMWIRPSDGVTTTKENIWHGILSFGGMLMIFLTFCLYPVLIFREDRHGAGLLAALLVFSLITGVFAVFNIFDEKSYVIASAVSEMYVLTMMSVVGYMTYYLAYRKSVANSRETDNRVSQVSR